MKTEVRRKDREMKSVEEMECFLGRMQVGRLAVMTSDGPYLIAVNYLFAEGSIYFHSSHDGRKIEALRADPRICFMVDEVGPQVLWEVRCGISQVYTSVVCHGRALFVTDTQEKKAILEKMVNRFVPEGYRRPELDSANIDRTAVIRIVVETMTGKNNLVSQLHTTIINRGNNA